QQGAAFLFERRSAKLHVPLPTRKAHVPSTDLFLASAQGSVWTSSLKVGADLTVQVNAGFLPLPLSRPLGNISHRGNFGERKPTEKLQVNHFGERCVSLGQLVQRFTDFGELPIINGIFDLASPRRYLELATAFLSTAA